MEQARYGYTHILSGAIEMAQLYTYCIGCNNYDTVIHILYLVQNRG